MSEIGDKIWVVPSGNAGRNVESPLVGTIIDINKNSFILDGRFLWNLHINKKTLKATGVKDCNSHYQAYLTEQDYLDAVGRVESWRKLRKMFESYNCPQGLNLKDLQDIIDIMNKVR